jgi:hypothetical protein
VQMVAFQAPTTNIATFYSTSAFNFTIINIPKKSIF